MEDYYKNKTGRLGRMARCKKCIKEVQQEVQRRTKEIPSEKRCGGCKKTKPEKEFYRNSARANGLSPYCKGCHDAKRKTPARMFTKYKQSARERNIPFSLSKAGFLAFAENPCHYCGEDNLPWLGLDRVSPSLGYRKSNVVRCCSTCNYSKRMQTVEEWLEHQKKVLRHMSRKKKET